MPQKSVEVGTVVLDATARTLATIAVKGPLKESDRIWIKSRESKKEPKSNFEQMVTEIFVNGRSAPSVSKHTTGKIQIFVMRQAYKGDVIYRITVKSGGGGGGSGGGSGGSGGRKPQPTTTPTGGPKGEPKGEPKSEPKGEPKGGPKGEPKSGPKGEPKSGPKGGGTKQRAAGGGGSGGGSSGPSKQKGGGSRG